MDITSIIIVYMEISCKGLWNQWLTQDSEDPLVLECKNNLSKYSKDDWKIMAKEAVDLTEMLGELVKYNISHDSHISSIAFKELDDHFRKWFFTIDKDNFIKFALFCKHDKGFNAFFEQFYPGLGNYLYDMILANIKKIGL